MTTRLFSVALGAGVDTEPAWLSLLSAAERCRADRFLRADDRRTFVAAHALKRLAIAAAVGTAPARLEFAVAPGGKPVLTAPATACAFNLSHTEGCVALAISNRAVGVDVENTRGIAVDRALAETALGPAAAAELGPDPSTDDWRLAFFVAWTAREAILKAEGTGLAQSMALVTIDGNSARIDRRRWRLDRWALPDHQMAVAWTGPGAVDHTALDGVDLTAWCRDRLPSSSGR